MNDRVSGWNRGWFSLRCALTALVCVLALAPACAAYAENGTAPAEALGDEGGYGVIPDYTPARSIHDSDEAIVGAQGGLSVQDSQDIPSSYSSVDAGFTTPIRDQGAIGSCWAFATMGALESSILAHGQMGASSSADEGVPAAEALDLSERHLLYFAYHPSVDPLGYTKGDYTKAGSGSFSVPDVSDYYLETGGNDYAGAYTLASWRGAVDEAVTPYADLANSYSRYLEAQYLDDDYPYEQLLSDTALDSSSAYGSESWHVSDIRRIALGDSDDVKRAVMEYGGATLSFYFDDAYFNFETSSYYYYDSYKTNHVAEIVGWDDDYSADNFPYVDAWAQERGLETDTKTARPKRDGAWLVKNSWGDYWGDGGYFWISYQDASLRDSLAKALVLEAVPAGDYDNIYQHDGSTGAYWNHVQSGGSVANVFTARAAGSSAETLDAVSFALDDVNVDYSIQVYVNLRDGADPESGSPALVQPVTGKTSYVGYYTVPLPVSVPLRSGDTYSVVITLSHASGKRVSYSVDASGGSGSWVTYNNAVHAGESFERDQEGARWDDLSSSSHEMGDEPKCSARVKAFTHNAAEDELVSIPFDGASVDLASGELDEGEFAYTGAQVRPPVTVKLGGAELAEGIDYTVSYANNVDPGLAVAVVSGMGLYAGECTLQFEIAKPAAPAASAKASNPMKVVAKKRVVKAAKLRKKARKVSCISFKRRAIGAVSYAKVAKGSSKRLSVNGKTGKIRVKKGTKRGTYKIRVKVHAVGNASYAAASKTLTCKVRVK